MTRDALLYIMVKPPMAIAREIDACHRSLQINSNYGAARFTARSCRLAAATAGMRNWVTGH
ncbi:MAG: hypothetical protein EOP61_25445 [Sphingomonadales bacterium]|nr:MAG: hypothetical protein EOP61_25445 [Sphingomonadales bacterium]